VGHVEPFQCVGGRQGAGAAVADTLTVHNGRRSIAQ
jgi:hypothetical protein